MELKAMPQRPRDEEIRPFDYVKLWTRNNVESFWGVYLGSVANRQGLHVIRLSNDLVSEPFGEGDLLLVRTGQFCSEATWAEYLEEYTASGNPLPIQLYD